MVFSVNLGAAVKKGKAAEAAEAEGGGDSFLHTGSSLTSQIEGTKGEDAPGSSGEHGASKSAGNTSWSMLGKKTHEERENDQNEDHDEKGNGSGANGMAGVMRIAGVARMREAALAAASTTTAAMQGTTNLLQKGGEVTLGAAAAAMHGTTNLLLKGNEATMHALKLDVVGEGFSSSIQAMREQLNTAGTAVGRMSEVFKKVDSVEEESSERKWDEYEEEEDTNGEGKGWETVLTDLEKEVLIAGLTDSEDMGPTVRAVHERGVADTVVTALEELSALRRADIMHVCDQERALDMMRSVQLMVTLKEEAAVSEARLANINTRFQANGSRLLAAQTEVANLRLVQQNLEEASEALEECVLVMRLCCLVRQHLRNNKVHAALKALQRLQTAGLHSPVRATSLSQLVMQLTPVLADQVKVEAVKELNSWLSSVRKISVKVGRMLLEGTLERGVKEEAARKSAARRVLGSGDAMFLKATVADEQLPDQKEKKVETDEIVGGEDYEDLLCGVGMDMGPLFRCLYLFRRFGELHELRTHLRKTRREHAVVDLAAPDWSEVASKTKGGGGGAVDACAVSGCGLSAGDPSSLLKPFLEKVLGFFVLDQTICGLSSGAFPRIQTEQEWISQSSVIVAVLSEACSVASDSAALVQLRSLVCLFCASLDQYNLTTRAIRASLDGQLEHYIALLLEEGREDVLTALKNDKPEALRIDNAVDYARLVVDLKLDSYLHPIQSPMEKAGKEEMSSYERKRRGLLPEAVTMIFSRSVPRLIQISKNFVFDLASFLDLSSPNCVQVLVQALGRFVSEVIKEEMNKVLQAGSKEAKAMAGRPLVKPTVKGAKTKKLTAAALHAMQISLNANILSKETPNLMQYAGSLSQIADETGAAAAAAQRSSACLATLQSDGEEAMFEHGEAIVDDILDRGEMPPNHANPSEGGFDWAPAESPVVTTPSFYILELSAYLHATFPHFSALAPEIREGLYYHTCKKIGTRILRQPRLPHVRKILLTAFTRANIDLQVLEGFATDAKVPGLKDCFTAPRQLLDLFLGPSLEVVTEEMTRLQKFSTVDIPQLIEILEKVWEPSAMSTMLFTTTTPSRKKEVDSVIRKLRELVKRGDEYK